MKIIADENIPYLHECFGHVGEVQALNGRHLTHADLADADALIVRSVTPVTRELLKGTPVRFVGSCTIGIDHVDTDYLDEKGITFASAPGSNADSAAQYVMSALMVLSERHGFSLQDKTVGIIGCGNVGSRVNKLLTALGVKTLLNDPPLKERGREGLVELESVLKADILTFHVPLTRDGKYPTWRMINQQFLDALAPETMLINTARGDLIDINALKTDISRHARRVVLDVWPNEPRIDENLLSMVQIATPHVAGYSFDGKLKGTEMVYKAFCQAMGIDYLEVDMAVEAPPAINASDDMTTEQAIRHAILTSYDILADDAALRELLNEPPAEQGVYFDKLRKHYAVRREYAAYACHGAHATALKPLGFKTV